MSLSEASGLAEMSSCAHVIAGPHGAFGVHAAGEFASARGLADGGMGRPPPIPHMSVGLRLRASSPNAPCRPRVACALPPLVVGRPSSGAQEIPLLIPSATAAQVSLRFLGAASSSSSPAACASTWGSSRHAPQEIVLGAACDPQGQGALKEWELQGTGVAVARHAACIATQRETGSSSAAPPLVRSVLHHARSAVRSHLFRLGWRGWAPSSGWPGSHQHPARQAEDPHCRLVQNWARAPRRGTAARAARGQWASAPPSGELPSVGRLLFGPPPTWRAALPGGARLWQATVSMHTAIRANCDPMSVEAI